MLAAWTATKMKRVQKFRSIEEMNRAPAPVRDSDEPHFERFKFRSLEEAQKAREKYR